MFNQKSSFPTAFTFARPPGEFRCGRFAFQTEQQEAKRMCDFSLQAFKSRPAQVADKLIVKDFGVGTRGFVSTVEAECDTAVCVMPGTEIAFDAPITQPGFFFPAKQVSAHSTAIFRQINLDQERMHHDCLELPDGEQILLTNLIAGQRATVLQLPAAPRNEAEAKAQTRLEVVG